MTFPVEIPNQTDQVVAELFEKSMDEAGSIKGRIPTHRSNLARGITGVEILDMVADFRGKRLILLGVSQAPNIVQVAKDVLGDQSRPIAAEFGAMITAIEDILTWVDANVDNPDVVDPVTAEPLRVLFSNLSDSID